MFMALTWEKTWSLETLHCVCIPSDYQVVVDQYGSAPSPPATDTLMHGKEDQNHTNVQVPYVNMQSTSIHQSLFHPLPYSLLLGSIETVR